MQTINKEEIKQKIENLEKFMENPNFWDDKIVAQNTIKEIQKLKNDLLGGEKYDHGGAILSILSGAGGDDAEDFSAMLFHMYMKYIEKMNWNAFLIHENKNDNGGYRNISIEINGKNVYGTLKYENGVHRLVRISPFNANAKRHTSFSLVEILPKLEGIDDVSIDHKDLKIEFSKSGGPGGQNVNKRETAVRVVHIPTNLSVHVTSERSQEQNKEKALEMLRGKIFKKEEEDKEKERAGLSISKTTEIEWGSQIRSYVLHPYKLIKDHRTGVEIHDVDSVLENGEIDEFIVAEKTMC
ncbi:TPA: peptide chain release factor 2 [Candidatus Nomurabacteria bacterium]|nr:MAG: peptide chain release factor 2 [Parcubacteria bacterium RAAC4_OD1_1]HCY26328.1 peptide chain release factor 2 [Candidatus Nomurabacteria bacterium]